MSGRQCARWVCLVVWMHLLAALACAPYPGDSNPALRSLPVAWQCPTPSPVPTVRIGWDEWTEQNDLGTPEVHRDPIYSTPVPTATPYVRQGADYYAGQRIDLGRYVLAAERDGARGVRVTIEVRGAQGAPPAEIHLGLSTVRVAIINGRQVTGAWSPAEDPNDGIWPIGTHTARLTFPTLDGTPLVYGLMLLSTDERRSGQPGGKPIWWTLQTDRSCAGKPGGKPSDAYDVAGPAGQPIFGRGSLPVAGSGALSRGYGCHAFFTGVRAPGCPAFAPWWHNGYDYPCSTRCGTYAVRDATVVYAGPDTGSLDCSGFAGSQPPHTGYGLYHRLRDVEGYTLIYGHQSRFLITHGNVRQRQKIGFVGSTGCSTGSHLHFSVYGPDGRERNPADILDKGGT